MSAHPSSSSLVAGSSLKLFSPKVMESVSSLACWAKEQSLQHTNTRISAVPVQAGRAGPTGRLPQCWPIRAEWGGAGSGPQRHRSSNTLVTSIDVFCLWYNKRFLQDPNTPTFCRFSLHSARPAPRCFYQHPSLTKTRRTVYSSVWTRFTWPSLACSSAPASLRSLSGQVFDSCKSSVRKSLHCTIGRKTAGGNDSGWVRAITAENFLPSKQNTGSSRCFTFGPLWPKLSDRSWSHSLTYLLPTGI